MPMKLINKQYYVNMLLILYFYDEYGNTTDLRYVDWSEGEDHPKTLDDTDYEKIMSSGKIVR